MLVWIDQLRVQPAVRLQNHRHKLGVHLSIFQEEEVIEGLQRIFEVICGRFVVNVLKQICNFCLNYWSHLFEKAPVVQFGDGVVVQKPFLENIDAGLQLVLQELW